MLVRMVVVAMVIVMVSKILIIFVVEDGDGDRDVHKHEDESEDGDAGEDEGNSCDDSDSAKYHGCEDGVAQHCSVEVHHSLLYIPAVNDARHREIVADDGRLSVGWHVGEVTAQLRA